MSGPYFPSEVEATVAHCPLSHVVVCVVGATLYLAAFQARTIFALQK